MDIEQTKRMNNLIQQLTKSGVVHQFDEAVSMAKGVYDKAMPDNFEPSCQKESTTEQSSALGDSMEYVERKIQSAINCNNQMINDRFGEQLDKIWNELKVLREIRSSQAQPVQQTIVPEPKVQKPMEASQPAGNSPRIGAYSPDNVQLEKFFYYGK